MSSLDTVLRLVEDNKIGLNDIKQVTVKLGATRIDQVGKIYEPQNVLGAQFSLPFTLGLALVKRRLDLGAFLDESLWKDPEILAFTRKVVMEVDPEAEKPYVQHTQAFNHRISGRVELTLTDGKKIEDINRPVKGLPAGDPVSWEELVQKFEKNAAAVISSKQAQRIVETVEKLDALSDVSELMAHVQA